MKISLLLFLYVLHGIKCTEPSSPLMEYLDSRYGIVSEKLSRHTRNGNMHTVKFNDLDKREFVGNYSRGEIFTLFGSPYALLNQEFFDVTNQTAIYRFQLKNVTFFKSTEFRKNAFLVFATQSNVLRIFGFNNDTKHIFKIHNIRHVDTTDVTFFPSDELYLIVLTHKSQDLSSVVVYKFVNSYFDKVDEVFTSKSRKIHTFRSSSTEIVMVLQEKAVVLYEFGDNKLEKIQIIDSENPTEIMDYIYLGQQYVIIFSKPDTVNLYKWTGSSLIFWEQFNVDIAGKSTIFYYQNEPYIFTEKNNTSTITNHKFITIHTSSRSNKTWSYVFLNNLLISLGPKTNKSVEIETRSISIQKTLAEQQTMEEEKLPKCFEHVETLVYKLRKKLKELENNTQTREARNDLDNIDNLQQKVAKAKKFLENLDAKILEINDSAVIDLPSGAEKVTFKDVHFDELNTKKWQPEKWLSYSSPQNISGPVKAHFMEVYNLESNNLKDVLMSQGDQTWSGSFTIKTLKVDQLDTEKLNNISVSDIYYKNQPEVIKGIKTFPEMRTGSIETNQINEMNRTQFVPMISKSNFNPNLTVDNLWVETINDVDFERLKQSVFRIGFDKIKGNLVFNNVRAKNMSFDTISKKSSVLTTSTNQIITSTIHIPKIFARNINSTKINEVDFRNSAIFGDVIQGPVSLKNLNVIKDLHVEHVVENDILLLNDSHIVGTNESDFLQRYNGKVKIKGNLIVKNLNLGKAQVFLNKHKFEESFDKFWLKTSPQVIPVHFQAKNGMSSPHLYASFINGINVNDYLLNSTEQKQEAKFYFDSVTIKGSVLLNGGEHSPDLKRIDQEAVKINGTFTIKGRKSYNVLKVDNLQADHVSGVNVKNNAKPIETLIVKGNFRAENLTVETINNVNIPDLVANTVYIDRNQNLTELNFKNVSADNFYVSKLNSVDMHELASKLKQLRNITEIDHVFIESNATIKNVENLSTINDQDVDKLLNQDFYKNNKIFGHVTFPDNIKIKNLVVRNVNDIDFKDLTQRMLYKSYNQTILANYEFARLKTSNLIVDKINNYEVGHLVDVSREEPQIIFADVVIGKDSKIENLAGLLECDLRENLKLLKNPKTQVWDRVVVTGNATFLDKEGLISRIFGEVVSSSKNNRIKVTFSNHISVNNITAKNINNIDIIEMSEDAVLNKPNLNQTITGKKFFANFEANNIECRNANIGLINNFNITEIDEKITTDLSDGVIKGRKVFFGGLQTKHLQTNFISGVKPEDIVSFESTKPIPNSVFEDVTVQNNFNIAYVNGMPFEKFNDRLLRTAEEQEVTGKYFFKNAQFAENIITSQINDIQMTDVVYDAGSQTIESPKKFLTNLKIIGNIRSDFINGIKLSETYEKSVLANESVNFTGIVKIMKPVLIQGNIQTQYINNMPVEYMFNTTSHLSLQNEAQQIYGITRIIQGFLGKYFNMTRRIPNEMLYLEKVVDLKMPIFNAVSARIMETKDDIVIHVESEETGNRCGLPEECKCPMQETIQISAEKSISSFMNKAMQRVYGYYEDDVVINVITHSISSGPKCRTKTAKVMNEISSLTWSVTPQKTNSGGFFLHREVFNGYVTAVEFFTIFGKTYIVLGIFYDPVLDSHKSNVLVLRFNDNKTAVQEIQKIPTEGLKTISVIPTAQGVVLVMGSDDGKNYTNTEIHRFSFEKQKFEYLRSLPMFGSLFAAGVVLSVDSLIILADKQATLLVLKHNEEFDNYILYQSFHLEYSVTSIEVFYSQDFGISDAYLSVVTANSQYFIYSFRFIEGWKLEFSGELGGARILVPFKLSQKSYLFAPHSKGSALFKMVEHDSD